MSDIHCFLNVVKWISFHILTFYIVEETPSDPALGHTARCDTIFVQIYMDGAPGVQGVSKNRNFFLQIKVLSFCARLPKLKKLQKTVKTEKKLLTMPVF